MKLSPLRYPGGKTRAVKYILELLPPDTTKVVSPFFGGGSAEIAMNNLGIDVIGYDIFDILVNYWNIQINHTDKLFDRLNELSPDKQTYSYIKSKLKDHWDNKIIMLPLELAACYYFNFNLSYGPGFLGWASSVYLDQKKYSSMIERVRTFKNKMDIKCDRFENILEQHRDDFLFLDPPYYLDGDSKMFRGIYPQRNFPIHHNGFNHNKLAELLKLHRGGFILCYNDCSYTRETYKDYKQSFPSWHYSMGQGETRIGKNRTENYIKKSHEMIIIGDKQ